MSKLSLLLLGTLLALSAVTGAALWRYIPQTASDTVICPGCQRRVQIMKSQEDAKCSSCGTVLKDYGILLGKKEGTHER